MKNLVILTVIIILSSAVSSGSKTSTDNTHVTDFSMISYSAKTFLATAD